MMRHLYTILFLIICFSIVKSENVNYIFNAIESYDYDYCENYVKLGGDVNLCDSSHNTLLMYAVNQSDYRIAYLLLSNGADKSCRNDVNKSAMDLAKEEGLIRMIKLLEDISTYSSTPTGNQYDIKLYQLIAENKFEEALKLAKYEELIASSEWKKNSKNYTNGLAHQVVVYCNMGNYDEAEKISQEVRKHLDKCCPETEWYYSWLSVMANIYVQQSHVGEAMTLLNECVAHDSILKKASIIQQIYNTRAAIYTLMGKYDEAIQDYNKCLNIIDYLPPIQIPYVYVNTKGNLSMLHYYKGTPESLHEFAIEMPDLLKYMQKYGMYNLNYLKYKQNWCVYLETYGSFQEAYESVKELKKETSLLLGCTHQEYATALNILGEICMKMDLLDEASAALFEAWEIVNTQGEDSRLKGSILKNLAILQNLRGENAEFAELAHVQAIDIALNSTGENSMDYLSAISSYVDYLSFVQKTPKKALPWAKKAFELSKSLSGKISLYTLNQQRLLWMTLAAIPEMRDSAYEELINYEKVTRQYLHNTYSVVSAQNWEEVWNNYFLATFSLNMNGFLLDYSMINHDCKKDLYNIELLSKNLLLFSECQLDKFLTSQADKMVARDWNSIKEIKARLYNSKFLSSSAYDSLTLQLKERELSILSRTKTNNDLFNNFTIRCGDIQNSLSENEVAIEFSSSSIAHWGQIDTIRTDSIMFYAYILRKNNDFPYIVPLFEFSEWQNLSKNNPIYQHCDYAQKKDIACQLIWGKILPFISPYDTIYFAPSNYLATLPLEYFAMNKDSVLCDRYHLVRVSSTRNLLSRKELCSPIKATLFGGIQYSVLPEMMIENSKAFQIAEIPVTRAICDSQDRGSMIYLPESKREIDGIARLYHAKGIKPIVYSGQKATEESFLSLSSKENGLIHIATHGFYNYKADTPQITQNALNNLSIIEDPLSRCGLLFAGANMAMTGKSSMLPEKVQDGILTAREISNLDLSNTDLVVLSACNTGLGDITNDGVAGLQRGFKMAGVNSIMMSLWSVDDAATYLLMTEFYKNYLGGKTKTESLREAQRYLRNYEQDGEKIFADPKYWAAFVLLDALN